MEVALVLVMAGLVAVSFAKDFMIWRQRKEMDSAEKANFDEALNWFRSFKADLLTIRHELSNQQLFRVSQAQTNRDFLHYQLTVFTEGIIAKLTEALKADVSTLKELIARGQKSDKDALFEKAVGLAYAEKHVNASMLRKHLGIGWKRSNALLEKLLQEKVVVQNGKIGNYLPIIQRGEV